MLQQKKREFEALQEENKELNLQLKGFMMEDRSFVSLTDHEKVLVQKQELVDGLKGSMK